MKRRFSTARSAALSILILPSLLPMLLPGALAQDKQDSQRCVPRIDYIADDDATLPLGSYERISPDGRYILRSYSGHRLGEVTLVEIVNTPQGKRLIHHETPLKNEAFPVQGSWRYLVNVNGDHYLFEDVLTQGKAAQPRFRGGMTGFYAAAAELTSARPNEVHLRSFSWPNASGGSATKQGVGALSVRTLTVDTREHRITADTGVQYICSERRRQDGTQYGLPMISVDGKAFSAVPQSPRDGQQQSMRVYRMGEAIHAPRCELKQDLQFASGKATFGFANEAGDADLVFEHRGDVWWYNAALKESFNLADYQQAARVGAFPGITKDGRVVVAATWLEGSDSCKLTLPLLTTPTGCSRRQGYAVIDPYQSAAYLNHWLAQKQAAPRACIARQ